MFGPPPPLPYTAALNAAVVHHCLFMNMGRGNRATLKLKELLFEMLPVSAQQQQMAAGGALGSRQLGLKQQQQRSGHAGLPGQLQGNKQQRLQQQHKGAAAHKLQQQQHKGQLAGSKRPAAAAAAAGVSMPSGDAAAGPPAKMRKQQQQHQQQQLLPGQKAAAAAAAAGAAGAAAAAVVPDHLGAGGLKVPKAFHDAAYEAARHAGAVPGLLEQLNEKQLRTWMQDKLRQCKDAGLPQSRQLLSDLIQEQLEDMLQQLETGGDAHVFVNPVTKEQVPDYAQEITHPMCLKWIREALHDGKYKIEIQQQQQPQQQQRPPLRVHSWQSLYALAHDVQLIVSNARMYNASRPRNRSVLDAAHALQKRAVRAWQNVQAGISSKLKQRVEAHRQQQQQ
jgi:hypothetical protein